MRAVTGIAVSEWMVTGNGGYDVEILANRIPDPDWHGRLCGEARRVQSLFHLAGVGALAGGHPMQRGATRKHRLLLTGHATPWR